MLQTRKPLAAPSPVSLAWATAGVNSWHLFQKRLKNVWSMYSMYSMSVQDNLQSSIRCLTRPKNVSPEAQGTTHLETTLWLSPHKNTSWIRIDKLRIELQERWTSTICFQSCVSSRLHRWIGESVAEIRCSFVEGQRSRFAAQACITSWNCMQKTVSGSYIIIYIYIIHIIHVVLEVPIVFHSPAFGEATTGDCVPSMFDARKKKKTCFEAATFSPLPQALVRYQSSGRTSPGNSWPWSSCPWCGAQKWGPNGPAKFGFCLYLCLYFWAIPISSSSPPLPKCRFLKMPAAPESPSAQAR